MKVFVLTSSPNSEYGGVGMLEWRFGREAMTTEACRMIFNSELTDRIVWHGQVEVPDGLTNVEITDHLDALIDY